MFKPEGLLLQEASRLGIGTNNCAEALGMASAIKTTSRFAPAAITPRVTSYEMITNSVFFIQCSKASQTQVQIASQRA